MAAPTERLEQSVSRDKPSRRLPAASSSTLPDALFFQLCRAAAALILVIAVLLLAVLVWQSWESIWTNGLEFFTTARWDPVQGPGHQRFGALAFIWGTVATSTIAMLIAVPLGVGVAAYLAEIAPHWLRRVGSFMVEMLAAIPSVVFGFWGLYVFAPSLQLIINLFGGPNTGGIGLLPAGIVLGIMIVPYVAAVSFDVIRAVPRSQREGALALGATRWQTIWTVVLPYAAGIIGGCFLAMGRALGETMAVTMLIGNTPDISLSPFSKGNSIPSVIANQFTEADYPLYLSSLVHLGLVLLLVSVGFSAVGRLLIWRMTRVGGRRWSVFKSSLVWSVNPSQLAPASDTSPAPNVAPQAPVSSTYRRARTARPTVSNSRQMGRVDFFMTGVLASCLLLTSLPLLFILGFLLFEGAGALNLDFFTKMPRPVGESGGGLVHAMYGSMVMVGLATVFAVPVGVLGAVYLGEYRTGWFGAVVRFVAEMLGSVPSIVIGIFGYYAVVKTVTVHFSAWAGAFALGVMMIPVIVRASEEALKLVPKTLREASYALGAARWQTVMRVTLPAALPAIITAVFLGVARVAGETAPLLLTASGNQFWPRSLNDATPSLPVSIFNYAISADADWHRQAWAGSFVLVMAVMLLNFGIRLLTGKRVLLASQAD